MSKNLRVTIHESATIEGAFLCQCYNGAEYLLTEVNEHARAGALLAHTRGRAIMTGRGVKTSANFDLEPNPYLK